MFELGTDGPLVIMAGVDGTESSTRAAAYASGLARRQGAKLALVYIQQYPASVSPAAASEVIAAGRATADDLRRQMAEAITRLPEGTVPNWELHIGEGDPYRGLCDFAEKLRADAVVIGASQKAGHRFVGSVAVRLVKAGKWPVTVVP
jgi:nucleotide-binding universal stress UspA family protein